MPRLLIEVLHGATPANDILAADCVVAFITAVFNDRGSKRLVRITVAARSRKTQRYDRLPGRLAGSANDGEHEHRDLTGVTPWQHRRGRTHATYPKRLGGSSRAACRSPPRSCRAGGRS